MVLAMGILLAATVCPRVLAQSQTTGEISAQTKSSSAATGSTDDQKNEIEEEVDSQPEPGVVEIDGRAILSVYQPIGSFTAKDRAEKIHERIVEAARDGLDPNSVAATTRQMWTEISVGGKFLLAISDGDAHSAATTRALLASRYVEEIRHALITYRIEHNGRAILKGVTYTLLATIALFAIIFILRKLRLYVRDRLEHWVKKLLHDPEKDTVFHITGAYFVSALLAVGSVLRWFTLIVLLELYVTIVLSFFPQTRWASHAVTGWILTALRSLGSSALDYLPNLFVVAVIIVIAGLVMRLITMLVNQIENGTINIRGFYPEWAGPSAKLIRIMVLALMVIVVFPYLPGSKSPAFQGISIFLGVLLSLGSTSAVANAIAGVILTYMRSFSVGDWVKIGDTVGEVEEKNMLVTRILTPKQETISIPNATVMSGSVMNFTRQAKNAGVIFHTTVTIGYDAPWKTVHQLLINAAFATESVLHVPAPFVLQTQLNDFYVSYELNAYTDVPRRMQFIYSDLHQNIQDRFNEAGLEICSPHFASLRDGNTIAIPAQYISRDYKAPSFQVDVQEKETGQTVASRRL
jgi:small-conductance mechanosensitive channel